MSSYNQPSLKMLAERKESHGLTGEEQALVRLSANATRAAMSDDFSDWDDEELLRGRRRDRGGTFKGPNPKVIPAGVVREHYKRVLSDAEAKLRGHLDDGINGLIELINGQDVDDNVRLKAIDMIMNRVMGKDPVKVEATVTAPWQSLLADSIDVTEREPRVVMEADSVDVTASEAPKKATRQRAPKQAKPKARAKPKVTRKRTK